MAWRKVRTGLSPSLVPSVVSSPLSPFLRSRAWTHSMRRWISDIRYLVASSTWTGARSSRRGARAKEPPATNHLVLASRLVLRLVPVPVLSMDLNLGPVLRRRVRSGSRPGRSRWIDSAAWNSSTSPRLRSPWRGRRNLRARGWRTSSRTVSPMRMTAPQSSMRSWLRATKRSGPMRSICSRRSMKPP